MAQTPDEIRVEIEETRADMTETVEALGHKVDVPGRVKASVAEKTDAAIGAVTSAADSVVDTVRRAATSVSDTVDHESAARGAKKGLAMARENPLGLVLGGAALGFLGGLLLPSTRIEDDKLGPVADDVREQIVEAGHDAVERGKDVVREAGHAAIDTARERGQEEGHELTEQLRDRLEEVTTRES